MSLLRPPAFAAIGVSIGPFKRPADREVVRRQLSVLSFLAVRDRRSMNAAEDLQLEMPVVQAADLAGIFADFVEKGTARPTPELTIGFAPCFDASRCGVDKKFCQSFVDAIPAFARETGHRPLVRIFCLNTHPLVGDADLGSATARQLAEKGFSCELVTYDRIGVEETWREIGATDLFVSGRLHGAVTAYLQGIPFLLHEYHSKCSDWLADIGQQDAMRISASSGEEIAEKLVAGLNNADLRPEVPVSVYKDMARRNFTESPWSAPPEPR